VLAATLWPSSTCTGHRRALITLELQALPQCPQWMLQACKGLACMWATLPVSVVPLAALPAASAPCWSPASAAWRPAALPYAWPRMLERVSATYCLGGCLMLHFTCQCVQCACPSPTRQTHPIPGTTQRHPQSPHPSSTSTTPHAARTMSFTVPGHLSGCTAVFEQVKLGPLLGCGAYGRVYRGQWRGTEVAVKVCRAGRRLAAWACVKWLVGAVPV